MTVADSYQAVIWRHSFDHVPSLACRACGPLYCDKQNGQEVAAWMRIKIVCYGANILLISIILCRGIIVYIKLYVILVYELWASTSVFLFLYVVQKLPDDGQKWPQHVADDNWTHCVRDAVVINADVEVAYISERARARDIARRVPIIALPNRPCARYKILRSECVEKRLFLLF